ncbi:MAG: T9SS type A sorting domain-containing protein [Bacteroidetes bacterium]|nr:T9SS type A sorting domain-containing protein [Bacteroidota bacterium]
MKSSQIDRPLNISINLQNLPENISITRAFAIALFIVFGTFLFSCTDHQGKKVDGIEIVNPEEERLMMGDISFIPPADFIESSETLSVDTLMTIDTLVTTYCSESHVAGGIESVAIPQEEIIPVEDITPIAKEEQLLDTYVLGVMMTPYQEKRDTLVVLPMDTVATKDTQRVISEEILTKTDKFEIYPNPGNGEFTIKYEVLKRADVHVDIYDMNGMLLKTIVDITDQYEGKYQIPVRLSDLPNGIYLVSLINNGKKSVERLVIER